MYWTLYLPPIGGGEMRAMAEMQQMMGRVMMSVFWHLAHFQARNFARYVAQPSDTLESIAARFDVKPEDIRFWNYLPDSKIQANTIITIPGAMVLRPVMMGQ